MAVMVGASPRCAEESAGGSIGERCARWQRGFKRLQRDADLVAQRFEPRLRARLAGFEHVLAHENLRPSFRACSPVRHHRPRERACAQMFAERLIRAFFCHSLGRGKFQPKLFFAILSGNAVGVGDVGGVMSAPACVGTWQAVG